MKHIFIITFLLLQSYLSTAQVQFIKGRISDSRTNQPLVGASVAVKGKVSGTVTDAKGQFELRTALPATIVVSMVGYESQELTAKESISFNLSLKESPNDLNQVVVSASRIEENILRSPVTVEKMDIRAVQNTPAPNFYDALNHLKGVDMVTSSLTYKQINTRGFNTTGNARFLQLVDNVDNQSAGLGFAMGNLFGPHDLDLESAELIPGAASALYGPIAFNGMLSMKTKNPFLYQGLSAQMKVGVNHIGDAGGAKPMGDFAIRYAKAFNDRFAFKINASYLGGTDWYGNNYTDIDPNTPEANRGPNNPGRNALNIYGDEVARTMAGIGRVSRTGYEEKHVANYDVYSLKLNGAVHYRITDKIELIYAAAMSQGTAQYTGSSRFVINDFRLMQHRLELKGNNFFVRAYSNAENSQNSYNSRSLAQHINRTWVRDLQGNIVTPDRADAVWFERYALAFNGGIEGITPQNHTTARAFADQGRALPGTPEFEAAKQRLINTYGIQGAGVLSRCGLRHIEGMYDFSPQIGFMSLQVGGNYRQFTLDTGGSLFDDKDKNLTNTEYGAFVQAAKSLWKDKLKITLSGRYDKNENFAGRFTPRASAVFSPNDNHHFRGSVQTGFRNPTIGDQYIKLNVGPIIILGGVPSNAAGLGAYENSFMAASVGAFASAAGAQLGQGVPFPTAVANHKNKLVQSNIPFLKPEKVTSFEVGYKGIFNQNLLFDINYYHSQYTDFIINTVVIRPNSPVTLPDGSINPAAAADILGGRTQAFQLYTNATDQVSIQGVSGGVSYSLPKYYRLNANATWTSFNLGNANPNNIPPFNTPQWKTNVTFGNAKLTERVGFNMAWHWQSAFDWFGTFTELRPGRIEAYSLLDAQVSYRLPALKTVLKVGGSNITNRYVMQAFGSPAVGGLYYVSLNFDELFR
ncbi:MAG: TonB-dependent receptor [Runella sp.]